MRQPWNDTDCTQQMFFFKWSSFNNHFPQKLSTCSLLWWLELPRTSLLVHTAHNTVCQVICKKNWMYKRNRSIFLYPLHHERTQQGTTRPPLGTSQSRCHGGYSAADVNDDGNVRTHFIWRSETEKKRNRIVPKKHPLHCTHNFLQESNKLHQCRVFVSIDFAHIAWYCT